MLRLCEFKNLIISSDIQEHSETEQQVKLLSFIFFMVKRVGGVHDVTYEWE